MCMRNRSIIARLAPAALLVLAGCMPDQPVPAPEPSPLPDTCGAARFLHLVGSPFASADFRGVKQMRVIPPGLAVTMDFIPDRLNVETDKTGRIVRIYCG